MASADISVGERGARAEEAGSDEKSYWFSSAVNFKDGDEDQSCM